jgi:hypothetical protein
VGGKASGRSRNASAAPPNEIFRRLHLKIDGRGITIRRDNCQFKEILRHEEVFTSRRSEGSEGGGRLMNDLYHLKSADVFPGPA